MSISDEILKSISVRDFYEGFGLRLDEVGVNDYKTTCPFHDDQVPSFTINRTNGLFKCHAGTCGVEGNIIHFFAKFRNIALDEAVKQLQKEYIEAPTQRQEAKIVPVTEVEGYHRFLVDTPGLVAILEKVWGLTLETITRYRLGVRRGYVTIPIPSFTGGWLNIQYHRIHPGPRKIFSYRDETGKGYGGNAIFPTQSLSEPGTIIWTSGPKDTLTLRQRGYNGASAIDGEGSFSEDWLAFFDGKDVIVLFDNDIAGRKASLKIADTLILVAKTLKILSLDTLVAENQDITDFFVKGGTVQELDALIAKTPLYTPESRPTPSSLPSVPLKAPPLPRVVEEIVNLMRGVTDAPTIYLKAAAIMCLAVSLSDILVVNPDRLHPNLWILLLGRTAKFRKTTVLRLTQDILNRLTIRVLPGYFTSEGLISELDSISTGDKYVGPVLWLKDEFAGILQEFKKDYQAGIKELLMELYDSGRVQRVLSKRKLSIQNVQFSLFSAGIPERIQNLLGESEILAGFVNRFLIFNASHKEVERPGMFALSTTEMDSVVHRLVTLREWYLNRLWNLDFSVGERAVSILPNTHLHHVVLSKVAEDKLRSYTVDLQTIVGEDYTRQALVERAELHVKKVAALFAAARCNVWANVITVSREDVVSGIWFYEESRKTAFDFFFGPGTGGVMMAETPMDRKFVRALRIIAKEGKINRGKLMQKTAMTKRDMDQFIATVKDRGDVKYIDLKRGATFLWQGESAS